MKNIILTTVAASALWITACSSKEADLNPTESVVNWKKDMIDGSVANLWNSLPKSYQVDVTKLAHSFGNKVDAEVYNEAMNTLVTACQLLKNKKAIILAMIEGQVPEEEGKNITNNYDSIVGLLGTIANSDAKNTDGLKALDVAKFLGAIQEHTNKLASLGALAGDDLEELKNTKVKLVSEDGNSAVVNVTFKENSEDMDLVKKGSRWVPADMVVAWPDMIKEANDALTKMEKMEALEKLQMIMMLKMIQTFVKDLEATKTKEEMMQKIQGLMAMFMG